MDINTLLIYLTKLKSIFSDIKHKMKINNISIDVKF